MTKYLYDCDSEFAAWLKDHEEDFLFSTDVEIARMAFEAGANMERCQHNNTTMAKSRDWCHDCDSWVFRDES